MHLHGTLQRRLNLKSYSQKVASKKGVELRVIMFICKTQNSASAKSRKERERKAYRRRSLRFVEICSDFWLNRDFLLFLLRFPWRPRALFVISFVRKLFFLGGDMLVIWFTNDPSSLRGLLRLLLLGQLGAPSVYRKDMYAPPMLIKQHQVGDALERQGRLKGGISLLPLTISKISFFRFAIVKFIFPFSKK